MKSLIWTLAILPSCAIALAFQSGRYMVFWGDSIWGIVPAAGLLASFFLGALLPSVLGMIVLSAKNDREGTLHVLRKYEGKSSNPL